MNRILITLTVLALGVLACGTYITPTPTPNATETLPTRTATALLTPTPNALGTTTPVWTADVAQPVVTVRDAPDGEPTGDYLSAGETVVILRCAGDWCRVKNPAGWVFRGCLSDNPNELGCSAK
jgi:hypothetical protein